MSQDPAAKPAILQESRFTVREGLAYRAMRTGAIWMNKLFFGSAILLAIWLLYGYLGGAQACVGGVPNVADGTDQGTTQECSVLLTPTAIYLGSMALLSYLLSIGFGLLGLVVGKQVLQMAPAASEVGAGGGHGRLATFLARARERVAAGAYSPGGEPLRPHGSFVGAIRGGSGIVAELKPASPSSGRLLRGPPEPILAAYRLGGASALSILTDADHFGGTPGLLRTAHAQGLPTLMKDFIVDEAQLACARHNGASAVLLIERCFAGEPERREALVDAAHALGLEVLLELFDAGDWATARDSKADLLGVNARDLETLKVDEAAARALVVEVAPHRPVLALSGVRRRADVLAARRAGAIGALVGTMLLEAPDAELALRALQRPLSKVCGLRTEADVVGAAKAGADLVGFVVGAPRSPRDRPPIVAQRLADTARALGLRPVLVTPHTDAWEVREWCRLVRPAFVQVSGFWPTAEWTHSLRSIPTHVLQAIEAGGGAAPDTDIAGFVADSPHGGLGGGTGEVHDWSRTLRLVDAHPGRLSLVAGGLDAQNAAAALAATGAWGADASSRLESEPGRKDPAKVLAFVQAVRNA